MSTNIQRLVGVLCVIGWMGGTTACGDDDPTDMGPLEEEDAAVSDGAVSDGEGGTGGRAAGSGGRDAMGGAGGSMEDGGTALDAGDPAEGTGGTGGMDAAGEGGAGAAGADAAGEGGAGAAGADAAGMGGAGAAGADAAGMGGAGVGGTAGTMEEPDDGVRLSDAEIVAVTAVVNVAEIEAGNTAHARAQSESVRTFAETMISTHTMLQARQTALAMTLGLVPAENDVSKMLLEQMQETRTRLMLASDQEFDLIYVESQVSAHTTALRILDEILLPSVMNDALRTELMSTRTSIENHLALAMDLLEELRATGQVRDAGM